MKNVNYICSGGGDDIKKILEDMSIAHSFKDKVIAYVIIASENDPGFLKFIRNGFGYLESIFLSLGAKEVFLVEEKNISDIERSNIIIISGGDTSYLLSISEKIDILSKLSKCHNLELIAGISAGTIALFEKGVGTKNKKEHVFNGLGMIPGLVVVHSSNMLKEKYPNAVHLKDYDQFVK